MNGVNREEERMHRWGAGGRGTMIKWEGINGQDSHAPCRLDGAHDDWLMVVMPHEADETVLMKSMKEAWRCLGALGKGPPSVI